MKKFGTFSDRTFLFEPGLNIIYGPNEAGKTTIFDAIESAFFRRTKNRRRYKGEVKVWLELPSSGEVEVGRKRPSWLEDIDIELFENIYFVRTGEVGFSKESQFLDSLKSKLLNLSGLYEAKNYIISLLGKSLKIFGERYTRSGELNQKLELKERELSELNDKKKNYLDIRDLLKKEKELSLKVKELEEARKVLLERQKLISQSQRKRFLFERYKRCQQAESIKKDIEDICEKLRTLSQFDERDGERLEKFQKEKKGMEDQLNFLDKQMEDTRLKIESKKKELKRLEKEKENFELEREKKILEMEQYRRFNREDEKILLALFEKKGYLEESKRKTLSKLKSLKEEIEKLMKFISYKDKVLSETKGFYKNSIFKILFGLLFVVVSIIFSFWRPWSLLGTVPSLAWTVFWANKLRSLKKDLSFKQKELEDDRLQLELKLSKVTDLEREADNCEKDLETLVRDIEEILKNAGVRDIVEYEASLKRRDALEKELENISKRLEILEKEISSFQRNIYEEQKRYKMLSSERKSCADKLVFFEKEIKTILERVGTDALSIFFKQLEEKKRLKVKLRALEERLPSYDIKKEMESLERELSQFRDIPDIVEGAQDVEKRLREVQLNLEAMKKEMGALRGAIDEKLETLGESEADVLSRLYKAEMEYRSLRDERREWLLVYEVLLEMEKRVEKRLLDILEREASNWFSYITSGRYSGLFFQDGHLFAKAGERTLNIEMLSTGTKDQLYLSARLAMAERLAKGSFFLLLDDPFLTFDEKRTLQLLSILKELSKKCQIILATKEKWLKEHLVDFANTIDLEEMAYNFEF